MMLKAASDADAVLSDTEITMLLYAPTFAVVGVPDSRPVVVLKLAHVGRLSTRNVSVLPSASAALGWKL